MYRAGDVWVSQDSGGDLEFFVRECFSMPNGQLYTRVVSWFHETEEEANEAANLYVSKRNHRRLVK